MHPILKLITVGSDSSLFAPPPVVNPVVNPIVSPVLTPPKTEEKEDKGYGKLSFFLLGLFIGSMLEPFTLVMMLFIGIIFNNQPFPESLGSITPQELLATIIKNFIRSMFALMSRDQNKQKS